MTPEEFKAYLQSAELSYSQCAALLGLNKRSIQKYASGVVVIPLIVEYALYWATFAEHPENSLPEATAETA